MYDYIFISYLYVYFLGVTFSTGRCGDWIDGGIKSSASYQKNYFIVVAIGLSGYR